MIQLVVETITPTVAEDYLLQNHSNRPLRQVRIKDYAQDMKRGNWRLTGEPIVFDAHGHLNDGQHRLWACIHSQTPFETVVVRNVDPETYLVRDRGRTRTPSDAISQNGYHYQDTLQSACNLFRCYQRRGDFDFRTNRAGVGGMTSEEALEILRENPGLNYSAHLVHSMKMPKHFGGRGFWTVFHYIATKRRGAHLADHFVRGVIAGDNITSYGPPGVLRERLLSESMGGTGRYKKPLHSLNHKAHAVVKAWNLFVKGETRIHPRALGFSTTAERTEKFPRIH